MPHQTYQTIFKALSWDTFDVECDGEFERYMNCVFKKSTANT